MKELLRSLYATLLRSDAKEPPAVRSATPGGTGAGVIDASTFQAIEVDKLFDSVNHAATVAGQATLYRSLVQPLDSGALIRAKQDAVREIEADAALREGLDALVNGAKALEKDFYDLLFGTFLGMIGSKAHPLEIEGYGYETYRNGTRFMLDLVDAARKLPTPNSDYLKTVVEDLRAFSDSRAHALMKGPVYRTEKGVCTRAEKGWFTPAVRFQPSLFKPVWLTVGVIFVLLVLEFVPLVLEMASSIAPVVWLFMLPISLVYIPIVGGFDRDGCIYPLRNIFKRSPDVQNALDNLGRLDELLSFIRFGEAFGQPTVLPEIIDGERHSLVLGGVRNPILGKHNPDYVPNDIALKDTRLTFVTGPNSGGKTAFCKTLAQTQLLAQIGCYVPAARAELGVADHIFYQVPEISHLADGEGRFGTELKRTKEIFLATTPKSLVIMDELSEGTTHEEKIEISMNILDGFYQKGNNTLLITHNHELVDRFQEKGIGLARQVEFENDQPTYRLVEGISRVSHADRVARKIGFSKEDIARYLGAK
jgi:DNA mismatch repair protein MutS